MQKTYDILFNIMDFGDTIKLNKKGINFYGKHLQKEKFFIQSINCDKTVNLCSKKHFLLGSVNIDMLNL